MRGEDDGGGGAAVRWCFLAQPASVRPATVSAKIAAGIAATGIAMERRKVTWSDRNARRARGQQQNRVFVEWGGREQFEAQMVLGSEGGAEAG
jgi:hypothetical protein